MMSSPITVSSFIVQHQVYYLIDSKIVKILFTSNQQHQVNISTCQLYTVQAITGDKKLRHSNRDILEPKLFCSTRAGVATSIETCTMSNIVKLLNTYCVYLEKKHTYTCKSLTVKYILLYCECPERLYCAENHKVINCSGFSSSFAIILLVSTTSGWDGSPSKYSGFSKVGKAIKGIGDLL